MLIGVMAFVLAFFAVTRTEVGRDELRSQIEQRFDDRFAGSVEIGRLDGNLVQDLFARDVRLFDPDGRLVLAVDSLVVRPTWGSLLRRRFDARSVEFVRPTVHLHQRANGSWTFADALRGLDDSTGIAAEGLQRARPFSLALATVRLHAARVVTTSEAPVAPAIATGRVFDYQHAQADSIHALFTVEREPGRSLIDLVALSARLPQLDLSLEELRGQFALTDSLIDLSAVRLTTERSTIRLSGRAERSANRWPSHLDLDLAAEPVDFDEWRALFPGLPLRHRARVDVIVTGPMAALDIETARVMSGAASASFAGSITGLPEAVAIGGTVRARWIRRDVLRLAPTLTLPDGWALDTARVALTVRGERPRVWRDSGRIAWPTVFEADGEIGLPADGLLTLAGKATRSPLGFEYEADVRGDGAMPRRLHTRAPVGVLTFAAELSGQTGRDTVHRIQLRRASGRLAGRTFEAVAADATLRGATLAADGAVQFAGDRGTVRFDGVVDGLGGSPGGTLTHRLALRTYALDLAALFPETRALQTRTDVALGWAGAGRDATTLTGTLDLDAQPSTVRFGEHTRRLAAHRQRMNVRLGETPRLGFDGDVLAGTLDLGHPVGASYAALAAWQPVLRRAVRQFIADRTPGDTVAFALAAPLSSEPTPLSIALDLRLVDSELLGGYLPALPRLDTDATLRARLDGDAEELHLEASVSADSLFRIKTDSAAVDDWARGFTAEIVATVSAHAPTPLRSASLDVRADSMRALANTVLAPSLTLALAGEAGRLAVRSAPLPGQSLSPLTLDADLALVGDALSLDLDRLDLLTGIYAWRLEEPAQLRLYQDALAVDRFGLVSRPARVVQDFDDTTAPQRVGLHGIASTQRADTLRVGFSDVALRPLVGLTRFRRVLGGRLDADVAIAAALGERSAGGDVIARTLSLDNIVLGDLTARASFTPGTPGIGLAIAIRPPALDIAPDTPGQSLVTTSRLDLDGTFVPASGETASQLDFALQAPDLDLKLLLLMFPVVGDVDGFARGSGRITGSLRRPAFDISLGGNAQRLTIPRFGLTYALDAEIDIVGTEGIRFRRARLRDPRGGEATLDGWMRFNEYRYFSFDIAGRLDRMQVMNQDRPGDLAFYGDLAASGDMTLIGPGYEPVLRSANASVTPESELYIPISEVEDLDTDRGFVLFADSTGALPNVQAFTRRRNIVAAKPEGERLFAEALALDLNITAPPGATVGLVFDDLIGDMLRAEGSGRVQLQRRQGEFTIYGGFDVDGGDYLFTAGDVFAREFQIQDGGSMTWDGNPLNAQLDIPAVYRTRASRAGLPTFGSQQQGLIPVVVNLDIGGRVLGPEIDLSLSVDRSERTQSGSYEEVEVYLNNPDRATEYATSVLLTNTFLLTPSEVSRESALASSGTITFSSLSALVSSQLTRILSEAIPNLDVRFGVQQGDRLSQLDLTGGLALYLLDDRLVIRGQGVVSQNDPARQQQEQGLEGEIAVEVRLTDAVAIEVFFRREGDVIADALTSTRGAGLTYQTQFTTWGRLLRRVFGGEDATLSPPPLLPVDSALVGTVIDPTTDSMQ